MGYSTITLRNGALGTGASFKTIAKEGMRLSEIVPTGYEDQAYWKGAKVAGFKEMVTIQVLNAGGDIAVDGKGKTRSFKFTRAYTGGAWKDGYWFRTGDKTDIISKENDEVFSVGEGLWVSVAGTAYSQTKCDPDAFKLMNNGEALLDAANMTLRNGAVMIIPTLSADVGLSKIIPTGYEDQSYWKGAKVAGFKEMITVQVLNAGGDVAVDGEGKTRSFKFTRAYTGGAWQNGYWFRTGDKTDIISEDNEETFKMGEALWVSVAGTAYSQTKCDPDAFKLQFPGIDDTYVTEE